MALLLLEHGEHVASGVLEPGYVQPLAAVIAESVTTALAAPDP
jgi:hypothetical protein